MSISPELTRTDGAKNYHGDLFHLKRVSEGAFEGAIPKLRVKAENLLKKEQALTPERRTAIIKELAGKPKYELEKILETL